MKTTLCILTFRP